MAREMADKGRRTSSGSQNVSWPLLWWCAYDGHEHRGSLDLPFYLVSLYSMYGQRGQLHIYPVNRHIYFRSAFNGDGLCRYIWRVGFDGQGLVKTIQANGGNSLGLD